MAFGEAGFGRYGEELTRRDLEDRGYHIIAEQAQLLFPNGKFFKPDFIAHDPATDTVVLVESKLGPGPKFTPNQLSGYEHYAKGLDDLLGRSPATSQTLARLTSTKKLHSPEPNSGVRRRRPAPVRH